VPASFTLTAPDGTRYRLDKDGKLTRIDFTDGAAWLVSDAGIVAVSGEPNERIDFRRDNTGRIARILLPGSEDGGQGTGDRTAIAYRYDTQGRLMLVRALDESSLGSPIAYDGAGKPIDDPFTANFGAIVGWNTGHDAWSGNLSGNDTFAFTVRESEIASTIHVSGEQGAVILALQANLPAGRRSPWPAGKSSVSPRRMGNRRISCASAKPASTRSASRGRERPN
jgi:hypothetical protein